MRSSTILAAAVSAFFASGADAAVTFVKTYARATTVLDATNSSPTGGTQQGSVTSLPGTAFGYTQSNSLSAAAASGSASASTYVTFAGPASGSVSVTASGGANTTDPQVGVIGQASNSFFYDFSSDTDFRIDFAYGILTSSNSASLPGLQFGLFVDYGTDQIYELRKLTSSGTDTTGRVAAGDYRLVISSDPIVGFSVGGATAFATRSLRGDVDFAINEVSGVPEPATWATMMLGFGLVGAAARRRRTAIA